MAGLFVPPRVQRELVEERLRYAADVINACHKDTICRRWDRELKRLDPLLEMVRAPERMMVEGTPLLPGYYHLVRMNVGAPPSVTPVNGPSGEFIEPPGSLLEKLKSQDLWNPDVRALQVRAQVAEQVRAERQKVAAREDRVAHMVDQYRSVTQASVSLNTDSPWTQNLAPSARAERSSRQKKPD